MHALQVKYLVVSICGDTQKIYEIWTKNIILQINRTDALSLTPHVFHDFIPSIYIVSMERSFVTESQTRIEKSTFASKRQRMEGEERQIENCEEAVARAYRWEKWAKKAHFRGGLSAGDVLLRYIAKGSICSASLSPFFAPTYTRTRSPHFDDVSDIGVTTAFYKVRDSAAGMRIRVPYPFYHSLSLLRSFLSVFPRTRYCLRTPQSCTPLAMFFNFYSTTLNVLMVSHNAFDDITHVGRLNIIIRFTNKFINRQINWNLCADSTHNQPQNLQCNIIIENIHFVFCRENLKFANIRRSYIFRSYN